MKKPRFTDEQMVTILREAKTKPVPDVAEKHASALGGGLPKLPVSKDLAAVQKRPRWQAATVVASKVSGSTRGGLLACPSVICGV